jgi:hypothetical protein
MHAVAAHQLHRASSTLYSFLRPVFITPMPPITSASILMARAFLFLADQVNQVQSLAHTHVGSSPILGAIAHVLCSIPVFITSTPPITSAA